MLIQVKIGCFGLNSLYTDLFIFCRHVFWKNVRPQYAVNKLFEKYLLKNNTDVGIGLILLRIYSKIPDFDAY